MAKINKIHVAPGIYWVSVPEADLYIQCGCPADSIKHLKKRGLCLEKEEDGFLYESGPNAILLSDELIQGGSFANLAEFPVLQMFYKQGMLIPNHPGNKGVKPVLIGSKEQVKAQLNYIYRGNYGLISKKEILATGVPDDVARTVWRYKLDFAFGNICKTEELLDYTQVDDERVEIRNEVFVKRKKTNVFQFQYKDESVDVDLNLAPNETYNIPYKLDYHNIYREYFAIIHSGEGDGWDYNRPCMGSILIYQGKLYLIDAGPNILKTLTALGIGVNEIEGVFVSHAHDDHFAGLTCIMRADHRLKFYTTPLVRSSVAKKLAALVGIREKELEDYFDLRDLVPDEWNDLEGLEIRPVLSPHPVETTIFFFRTFWDGGYKTYAHLADIASFRVMKRMVSGNSSKMGMSRSHFEEIKKVYRTPAELKKVDIGGGAIHGEAEDFRGDESDKMVLSHTSLELTNKEREIGSGAPFGMVDVLIPSHQNYATSNALKFLHDYFSEVPIHQISVLLNNPIETYNPETLLLKKGTVNEFIYLILTGSVEAIIGSKNSRHVLCAGSFVGESSGLSQKPTREAFRALNFVNALKIPCNLYRGFLEHNGLYEDILRLQKYRHFLQHTWLFGDMITYQLQNNLVRSMKEHTYKKGRSFTRKAYSDLFVVASGRVQILAENGRREMLKAGDFWGEEGVLYGKKSPYRAKMLSESTILTFPRKVLRNIPIVRWKMFEVHTHRQ